MLRVLPDALTSADNREVTLLPCSICRRRFNCVGHSVLLQRLQRNFDLNGAVLRWLITFLSDRSQQLIYDGRLSAIQRVWFGIPQGSVLGFLLFTIYTAEVSC